MNENGTIATPPSELVKILILQRRNDVLDAIEGYYKMKCAGAEAPKHVVQARIRSLFLEREASLRRQYSTEDFKLLETKVFGNSIDESIKAFREIDEYLDRLQITKVDNRQRIDTTNVEAENVGKGL